MGKMVTEKLLEKGIHNLAVLVRDPEKAKDLEDSGVDIRKGN